MAGDKKQLQRSVSMGCIGSEFDHSMKRSSSDIMEDLARQFKHKEFAQTHKIQSLVEKLVASQNQRYEKLERRLERAMKKLADNKVFLFMVIHDLRHPTEAVRNKLQELHQIVRQMYLDLAELQPNNEELN